MPKPPATTKNGIKKRLAHFLLKTPKNVIPLFDSLMKSSHKNILDRQAMRMINGVLQVSELHVKDVMIPRAQMVTVPPLAVIADILPTIIDSSHSRFPVLSQEQDNVIGILLAKDLLPSLLQPHTINQAITELIRPASFIPESKRIDILLEEFRSNKNHMAIVVDEFGGTAGIITIEDVLEEIVGEIEDEHDSSPVAPIKRVNGDTYLVSGQTTLQQINLQLQTDFDSNKVDTIGGLINLKLGRIAKRGEHIALDHLHMKILEANARCISKIQIKIGKPGKTSKT